MGEKQVSYLLNHIIITYITHIVKANWQKDEKLTESLRNELMKKNNQQLMNNKIRIIPIEYFLGIPEKYRLGGNMWKLIKFKIEVKLLVCNN